MPGHLNIRNPIHLNIWQLHLYKYTNWYFILPPGPRGLARPRHIYMSLPYTSRIYIKQQNTWLEVLTILKHMKVNGKDYTINYGKENSCLKPPTRHDNYMLFIYIYIHTVSPFIASKTRFTKGHPATMWVLNICYPIVLITILQSTLPLWVFKKKHTV
jgi:hypothetical protein